MGNEWRLIIKLSPEESQIRLHSAMLDFEIKEIVAALIGQAAAMKENWWFESLSILYNKSKEVSDAEANRIRP